MAGGDDDWRSRLRTGVWWDLNTCPVPAGIDPLSVRRCIQSALQEKIGRSTAVTIYAIGNLEYMDSDFLERISYSGIILVHAPCGALEFMGFLRQFAAATSGAESRYTLLISDDYRLADRYVYQPFRSLTKFFAYPKDGRLIPFSKGTNAPVLPNDFVWETLLFDHYPNIALNRRKNDFLYICNMCDAFYDFFDEFYTHLNSEEHLQELLDMVPRDYSSGEPKHFCQVCNHPTYDHYNLLLHNKSEKHLSKVQKVQKEEDNESRKRIPEWSPFEERNKKQSLDRGEANNEHLA